MHRGLIVEAIKLIPLIFLISCSNPQIDIPTKIVDNTGNLHYYTMHRMTTMNQHIKWCELHQTWENVETVNE